MVDWFHSQFSSDPQFNLYTLFNDPDWFRDGLLTCNLWWLYTTLHYENYHCWDRKYSFVFCVWLIHNVTLIPSHRIRFIYRTALEVQCNRERIIVLRFCVVLNQNWKNRSDDKRDKNKLKSVKRASQRLIYLSNPFGL